jgi:hypothetical protein
LLLLLPLLLARSIFPFFDDDDKPPFPTEA